MCNDLVPLSLSLKDVEYEDGSEGYYAEASLAHFVQEFLSHLNSSPGSFESDIEQITATLNDWVTTEATLQELVELIFTQVLAHLLQAVRVLQV